MGHVYRAQGDIEKATTYYDKAIVVLANLVKEYPRDVSNRQELALAYHNRGLHFHYSGDTQHASEFFQRATDNYAQAVEDCPGAQFTYECPYVRSLNNYAWFLATCPQAKFRDPAKSIELVTIAINLQPEQWEYWNTLGVARYRCNKMSEAIKALEQSCSKSGGGNAFDFFFLAMAHYQSGHIDKAKEYYAKAMEDSKGGATLIEPIHHLRKEAEGLMGHLETEKSQPVAKGIGKKGE